jgi:hypothetical protein
VFVKSRIEKSVSKQWCVTKAFSQPDFSPTCAVESEAMMSSARCDDDHVEALPESSPMDDTDRCGFLASMLPLRTEDRMLFLEDLFLGFWELTSLLSLPGSWRNP